MARLCMPAILGGLLLSASASRAEDFNWDNMLHAFMSLNKDFEYSDRQVDSYMQVYRKDKWEAVHQNEFELREARKEVLQQMKSKVKEFKVDQTFTLHAKLELKAYDFDLKGFPIENMSDTHYWYTGAHHYADRLPSTFHLYFSNTKPFNLVKMNEEAARQLIKARTDRYGRVDREITANVQFRLEKVKNDDPAFVAKIESVTLYTDKSKTKVLAEISTSGEKGDKKPPTSVRFDR